jgi:peptide/nickel transport system ATP-binding protein
MDFQLARNETLALVGESGCGKSVTALSIMRLMPPRLGRIVSGSDRVRGRDLAGLSEAEMRAVRGNRIAMIFQEPMTSLNPVLTIGDQVAEAVHDPPRKDRSADGARGRNAASWCASPRTPSASCATIRTSSPAACASA